jgi:hypothetical protein
MQRVQPDALTVAEFKERLEAFGRYIDVQRLPGAVPASLEETIAEMAACIEGFMSALERAQPKEEDPRQLRLFD